MSVYIGNLSYELDEQDVRDVFAEYGSVTRVSLPIDRETGRKRGFGFVEMQTEAQEQQAIDELDGAEWMERVLKVNKAKPREQRSNNRGFSRSR